MVAWEIATLVDRGRLVLGLPLDTCVERSLAARDVPVSRAIDRAPVPADERILRYAAAGHVRAIDARG